MKLTEAQIWKCNNDGEGGFHICLDHQNVVDFARSIEREIGFAKAELWIKRINDAVVAEREACEAAVEDIARKYQKAHEASLENIADECAAAIRARGTT